MHVLGIHIYKAMLPIVLRLPAVRNCALCFSDGDPQRKYLTAFSCQVSPLTQRQSTMASSLVLPMLSDLPSILSHTSPSPPANFPSVPSFYKK